MPLSKPDAARIKRVLNQLRKTTAPLSQAHADLWPPQFESLRDQVDSALDLSTGVIAQIEEMLETDTMDSVLAEPKK